MKTVYTEPAERRNTRKVRGRAADEFLKTCTRVDGLGPTDT
jgi:hypothetical protein